MADLSVHRELLNRAPRGLRLVGLCLVLGVASPVAYAICGAIPATYALSGGGELDIKSGVTINGNAVLEAKTGADSVLGMDGTRSTVSQTLPDLDPASFPANSSTTDADESDSPFISSTAVFYDEIKIDSNQTAIFSGGGPFHIDKLELKDGATLNLAAGTYFINEWKLEDNVVVNITSDVVFLHIGDKADMKKDVTINSGGSVTGLQVSLHDDAEFKADEGLDFTGRILGPAAKKVEFKKDSTIHGLIVTSGDVKIEKDTEITYDASDQAAVGALTSCVTPDHFAFSHDGAGINCLGESITVTMHLADDNVAVNYTGTATLSTDTAHGDWTKLNAAGTLVNSGGGVASYEFVSADSGSVVLGFKDTFPETVNLNIAAGVLSETEDASLTFTASGFNFLSAGVKNTIGTQIAGKPSNQFSGAPVLEIEAVDTNTDTGACEAALQGIVVVPLAFECEDPIACTVNRVTINGTGIAANGNDAIGTYTNVNLDFGDATDTTATVVFDYDDSGQVKLHARYEIPLEGGGGSGNFMAGASNGFVVRPFGFDIDFADDRATSGGVSDAADANGSAFAKAGAAFAAQVTAVLWETADDSDEDGLPDLGANLADNTATLNFGQELTAATVDFTRTLFEPSAGAAGNLSGGSAVGGFSNGVATVNLSWDEVGIIHLIATHISYLGSGVNVSGVVNNVGRFVPARLDVTTTGFAFRNGPDVGWGCGFTYLNQPFAFSTDPVVTLTGRNSAGLVTQNYGSSFWKFSGNFTLRTYTNTQVTTATLDAPALGTVSLSEQTDFDGDGELTISDESFAYLKSTAPIAPFTAQATLTLAGGNSITAGDLQDSDGVCYHPSASSCNVNDGDSYPAFTVTGVTGSLLRFGRLRLTNANGSELLPIGLPLVAEQFDGAGFVIHTVDICTAIATTFIDLDNDQEDPAQGDAQIDIGALTTTASIANSPLVGGDGGLVFSAPGAGNIGYADTSFNLDLVGGAAMPWLYFDWDGDGNHDNNPSGRVTFGVYQGSRYLIHIREPWN